MASHVMPSKQAVHALMVPWSELLMDLVLSFIGYYTLVFALYLPITWFFLQPRLSTFDQVILFVEWRNEITRCRAELYQ